MFHFKQNLSAVNLLINVYIYIYKERTIVRKPTISMFALNKYYLYNIFIIIISMRVCHFSIKVLKNPLCLILRKVNSKHRCIYFCNNSFKSLLFLNVSSAINCFLLFNAHL